MWRYFGRQAHYLPRVCQSGHAGGSKGNILATESQLGSTKNQRPGDIEANLHSDGGLWRKMMK